MNKWVALIIGIFVLGLGCAVAASIGEESRTAGLVVLLAGHLLALLVFIIFLRKHTPLLLAGIMLQVMVILGLWLVQYGDSEMVGKQAENPGVQGPLLREQAFEQCVGEFKEGLAQQC